MKRIPVHALALVAAHAFASDLPARTAIDDYVQAADDSSWKIISSAEADGLTTIVVDLVSQSWLTAEEVDRTEWQHWLTLTIPAEVASNVALLYIGGGSNGREPPAAPRREMAAIARATGTVVAELGMVPNQPLVFHGDGKPRYEDDLIGYAWVQYLRTGEPRWLPRNAMVKSAVRAMDAVSAVMAGEAGGERTVDRFVVAGASKRGWTTWMVGAMDARVVGIIPIVIDVLNVTPSMRHHFAAYGFWAPSIGDYVAHGIMRHLDDPKLAELYRLVDPFYYRHRLAMPKLVLNAAGDQFFLPDSAQFYWRDLRGESYLRIVPNADHGLGGSDAVETIAAFHALLAQGRKPPQLSWTKKQGTLRVLTEQEPAEVRLWQATNPQARDFRLETLGAAFADTVVEADAPGLYSARVEAPESGWTAWFLELAYDVGAASPLKLSTEVMVTPDTLPFADKAADGPASATILCRVGEGELADLAEAVQSFGQNVEVAAAGMATEVHDGVFYVNWTPAGDIRASAAVVQGFLQERGCENFNYQLESGPGATIPPVQPKM